MLKRTQRMRISIYRPAKLKLHGSACPPFWILTFEWFWWRNRFQIASFSPCTLENSVLKKHRFQIAPLWRAFSNGSLFGDRQRCSVDDSRIRSKTAPFSFENGLGPVHTNPFSNENWAVSFRRRLSSTLQRWKRSPKTEPFENALQGGAIWKRCFLKTLFSSVHGENDSIWKRWCHQNHSTVSIQNGGQALVVDNVGN